MAPEVLAATNALLADPPELDFSVSQRLGFHVVARLAARHGINVMLSATPGSGVTALVRIPATLTTEPSDRPSSPITGPLPVTEGRTVAEWAPQPVAQPVPHPRPQPVAQAVPQPRPHPAPRALPHIAARHEGPPAPARPKPEPKAPPAVVPAARTPEGSPWDVGAWDGWWAPPTPDEDGAAATGAPATPPPAQTAAPALRRRVPQTHLVEQLRVPEPDDVSDGTDRAARAARDAANALTRYQAARASASTDGQR